MSHINNTTFANVMARMRASDRPANVPGGTDTIGHSSVQAWSAGDIFPAVIAKVEVYIPAERYSEDVSLDYRRVTAYYELILDGITDRYATYSDARYAAIGLLACPELRAARHAEGGES